MKSFQLILALFFSATTWAYSKTEWVFCAKVNDSLEPLYGMPVGNENMKMFIHGNPSAELLTFDIENDAVYSAKRFGHQAVGFYKDELVFGSHLAPKIFNRKCSGQITDGPFHSCDISDLADGKARGILRGAPPMDAKYCFPVDIYLLPIEVVVQAIADDSVWKQMEILFKVHENDGNIFCYGQSLHESSNENPKDPNRYKVLCEV